MNNTLNRSNAMAATRALAKARLGDREALKYLVERRAEGDIAAARALEDYNKHMIVRVDATILNPN